MKQMLIGIRLQTHDRTTPLNIANNEYHNDILGRDSGLHHVFHAVNIVHVALSAHWLHVASSDFDKKGGKSLYSLKTKNVKV
jgi:hypothetical protein